MTIAITAFLLFGGCDQNIIPPSGIEGYYLEGAVVKNLDLDKLSVLVSLKRNDSVLSNATLYIGNDTLVYGSGQYFKTYSSISDLAEGDHTLKIYDTTFFIDSVNFSIASDFEITSKIPPDTTPYRSGDMARIEWSIPTNVDGYVYSASKEDEIYTNSGYSAFVTTGATAVTFNPDAFALPSSELDTGWYYIYVYGYKDSPVTSDNVPTVFPAGLDNSVSKVHFTAKFGSVIVTPRDSIHATAQ